MPARRRRPRGYIEELPSGSFRAVVYAGADPLTGRPRYIRETAGTYDAAEVALTRLQGQVDEDRHPKTDITLGRAIEQWLDVADLEDTTRDRYEDLVRIYTSPTSPAEFPPPTNPRPPSAAHKRRSPRSNIAAPWTGDVLALGVQRVGGDHHPGQVDASHPR